MHTQFVHNVLIMLVFMKYIFTVSSAVASNVVTDINTNSLSMLMPKFRTPLSSPATHQAPTIIPATVVIPHSSNNKPKYTPDYVRYLSEVTQILNQQISIKQKVSMLKRLIDSTFSGNLTLNSLTELALELKADGTQDEIAIALLIAYAQQLVEVDKVLDKEVVTYQLEVLVNDIYQQGDFCFPDFSLWRLITRGSFSLGCTQEFLALPYSNEIQEIIDVFIKNQTEKMCQVAFDELETNGNLQFKGMNISLFKLEGYLDSIDDIAIDYTSDYLISNTASRAEQPYYYFGDWFFNLPYLITQNNQKYVVFNNRRIHYDELKSHLYDHMESSYGDYNLTFFDNGSLKTRSRGGYIERYSYKEIFGKLALKTIEVIDAVHNIPVNRFVFDYVTENNQIIIKSNRLNDIIVLDFDENYGNLIRTADSTTGITMDYSYETKNSGDKFSVILKQQSNIGFVSEHVLTTFEFNNKIYPYIQKLTNSLPGVASLASVFKTSFSFKYLKDTNTCLFEKKDENNIGLNHTKLLEIISSQFSHSLSFDSSKTEYAYNASENKRNIAAFSMKCDGNDNANCQYSFPNEASVETFKNNSSTLTSLIPHIQSNNGLFTINTGGKYIEKKINNLGITDYMLSSIKGLNWTNYMFPNSSNMRVLNSHPGSNNANVWFKYDTANSRALFINQNKATLEGYDGNASFKAKSNLLVKSLQNELTVIKKSEAERLNLNVSTLGRPNLLLDFTSKHYVNVIFAPVMLGLVLRGLNLVGVGNGATFNLVVSLIRHAIALYSLSDEINTLGLKSMMLAISKAAFFVDAFDFFSQDQRFYMGLVFSMSENVLWKLSSDDPQISHQTSQQRIFGGLGVGLIGFSMDQKVCKPMIDKMSELEYVDGIYYEADNHMGGDNIVNGVYRNTPDVITTAVVCYGARGAMQGVWLNFLDYEFGRTSSVNWGNYLIYGALSAGLFTPYRILPLFENRALIQALLPAPSDSLEMYAIYFM